MDTGNSMLYVYSIIHSFVFLFIWIGVDPGAAGMQVNTVLSVCILLLIIIVGYNRW
jgi:hypothetical protein